MTLTLEISYNYASSGISTTLDASTTNGKFTAGTDSITFSSMEQIFIRGSNYNDTILGGNGNDSIYAGYGGDDSLSGGAGNDFLVNS